MPEAPVPMLMKDHRDPFHDGESFLTELYSATTEFF